MAFGNFFNKVSGSVRNAINNITNQLKQTTFKDVPGGQTAPNPQPPPTTQNTQSNIYFYTTTTGLSQVAARAVAGIMVHLDSDVSYALSEAIGEAGVDRFREALAPIRRTGELENSFQYNIVNNGRGVVIYSDHPAASAIQYGYQGAGSIETLQQWMEHKAEFRGLDDKEQKRAAYFIMKKIRNHYPPGKNSDLRRLAPVGERRYDYLTVVRDALEKDVQQLIVDYIDAANRG